MVDRWWIDANQYFTKGKYILILENKTQMKLVEEQSLYRGIELFDGKL